VMWISLAGKHGSWLRCPKRAFQLRRCDSNMRP